MRTVGKFIATEPFKETSIKHRVANGIAVMETRLSLTPLRVLWDGDKFCTGSTVYVQTESVTRHAWTRQVYTHKGVDFILVPEEFALMSELPK